MIDASYYSYSDKTLRVFDNILFVILAGIAVTMVVYAIVIRKFFSVGFLFILSTVMVLQDYFIKKLNVRFYIDLIVLMLGACVLWLDRKVRKKTDS